MSQLNLAHSPQALPHDQTARVLTAACLALAISYAIFLAGSFVQGYFLVDQQGYGIASDFAPVWAAGHLVLGGNPAGAYDWDLQLQAQAVAVGHRIPGDPVWPYPPFFLFPVALIASLPFVPASIAWLVATASAYIATMRAILGPRIGVLFACGFPGALWNISAGQLGFLHATLIGGALALMERRPLLAGVCIGLQAYKPQLGLLFPLVLVATGRWRAFFAAAATVVALVILSWAAFGTATWEAFLHMLATVNQRTLIQGAGGWNKLQTVFALVRAWGGSANLAWMVQGAVSVAVAAAVIATWRSRVPYDLKAAALGVGALLISPYLFIYDLALLAVPVAFLVRYAMARGFRRSEQILLPVAGALLLSYIVVTTQVGLAAVLIVALLIAQRTLCALSPEWRS
jgi:hypothetical protein